MLSCNVGWVILKVYERHVAHFHREDMEYGGMIRGVGNLDGRHC